MSLQITTNINVDFYDKKYIMINAKQYDSSSRWIMITCYDDGNLLNLNAKKHTAYIRYRKADGNGILNSSQINYKGQILVELTEQMLSADGICYVDLIIVNKGSAKVNINTGEIVTIDDSPIMSTMAFCVNVYESAVDNSLIESTYEYECNGLNDLLQRADADYQEVIQLARSYAMGDANDIRENEDYDNAKYYYEQSLKSSQSAESSKSAASVSENNAKTYMGKAEEYKNSASQSETNASKSASAASTSADNASKSESASASSASDASQSASSASASASSASQSATNASNSASSASISANNANTSETNASNSANKAQSYAVGGTGTRDNEDYDNAHYYYELIKNIVVGLDSAFIPMGTVSFSELASVEKATGYMYNISNDFVTDNSFREGEGRSYTAGTNVYFTANGEWDCFGGAASPTATVSEVKDYLGI